MEGLGLAVTVLATRARKRKDAARLDKHPRKMMNVMEIDCTVM